MSTSNDSRVLLGIMTPATATMQYTTALTTAYTIRARRAPPSVQAKATATSIALTLHA